MKTITKLGLAVTLLFLVSFFTQANAQSHDVKARNCKYWKKSPNPGSGAEVTDFSVCKVCSEKKDKEEAAKRAEDKRRADALVAKTKADNERKAKEAAEKQRLQNEKNKPVNATIVMSPNTGKSTPAKTKEKKDVKMEKNYFYVSPETASKTRRMHYDADYDFSHGDDGWQNLIDSNIPYPVERLSEGFIINNQKVFAQKYILCKGIASDKDNQFNFPPNIGIVQLNEFPFSFNGKHYPIYKKLYDLIDIKGNRILNDNTIIFIDHIIDDWFIIERDPNRVSEKGRSLYNYKTKQNLIFDYLDLYEVSFRSYTKESIKDDKLVNEDYRAKLGGRYSKLYILIKADGTVKTIKK